MRTRALGLAAALLLTGAGAAALAQSQSAPQENPESLLPPGFGEPVPTPAPTAAGPPPALVNGTAPAPLPSPTSSPTAIPTPDPAQLAKYEMPAFAQRSLALVGSADQAMTPDAFGGADGAYLEELMRRLSAPLPSRWLSIALRRALAQPLTTPLGVNGADFAAERAWLLLRMGESVAARSVVQGVDTGNTTPKLRQLVMQVALATGDPTALCGQVDAALAGRSSERGWVMARAICAGLSGVHGEARPLLRQARRARVADGVDLQLAEKVIGAGTDSRQAVTIEWDSVVQLTAWRWGLATATGVAVPEPLYASVGPQLYGWRALAPAIPPALRVAIAERAATMGVLSSAALVDLYGELDSAEDTPSAVAAVANDLQRAYVGADAAARADALTDLWDNVTDPTARYARLIMTARAAARVRPGENAEADRLVAAMLTAGLDRLAQRWRGNVAEGSDGWALLAVTDPAGGTVSYGALSDYAGAGDAARKQRLLFAGLAGLGRLTRADVERAAESLEVPIGHENSWTRALDRAVRDRQPATVLLLAAVGMQTPSWRGVPPEALYRIVGALRSVGLGGEARMIAAEAITRA